MEVGRRFSKDLVYYAVGIALPGIVNAASIPVLKWMLGATGFGFYSIRQGFMLLLTTGAIGWLCQSVIRFRYRHPEQASEAYNGQMLRMAAGILAIAASLVLLLYRWWVPDSWLLVGLFATAFLLCGFQNLILAITQANFNAKHTVYSEALRTVSFLGFGVLFIWMRPGYATEMLFAALIVSYLLSISLLLHIGRLRISKLFSRSVPGSATKGPTDRREIFQYGLPLAYWFLISFILSYADKLALAGLLGYESQGHYQAMHDLISRGVSFLMLPVVYALYPVMSKAFESQAESKAMALLKKIVLLELLFLVLALAAYWLFGFRLVAWLLKVPVDPNFFHTGWLMLATGILWQMNMLLHKPFEMRYNTRLMALFVSAALVVYGCSLYLVYRTRPAEVYVFTLPFLAATLTYMSACIWQLSSHKRRMLQQRFRQGSSHYTP